MKPIAFLILALLVCSFASAQTPQAITQVTDSAGTANAYWQKVDLLTSSARWVDVVNDGGVNLKVALLYGDTTSAASNSRYQSTVKPGEILPLYTATRYADIKAASSTCAYRVGGSK